MTSTFTGNLQASLAPFADPAGAWQALNAALGTMFEQAYGVGADQGTPDCPPVGLTSSPLSTSGAITSIPVQGALQPIPSGTLVMVVASGGQPWQQFTTSNSTLQNATSIPVQSQTPSFAFPTGSYVALGYRASWSSVLDPVACPTAFLPYLGQFLGVSVQPGTSDTVGRAAINQHAGFSRGTPAAIIAAAQAQLNGSRTVILIERYGLGGPDPYHFIVQVRPEQIVTSTAAITNAVNAVKPAGLQWSLVVSDGTIWATETHTWAADTQTWVQKG